MILLLLIHSCKEKEEFVCPETLDIEPREFTAIEESYFEPFFDLDKMTFVNEFNDSVTFELKDKIEHELVREFEGKYPCEYFPGDSVEIYLNYFDYDYTYKSESNDAIRVKLRKINSTYSALEFTREKESWVTYYLDIELIKWNSGTYIETAPKISSPSSIFENTIGEFSHFGFSYINTYEFAIFDDNNEIYFNKEFGIVGFLDRESGYYILKK